MALLFAEGFDDFATAADISLTASAVPGDSVGIFPGRGGIGHAIEISTQNSVVWSFAGASPLVVGFAIEASEQFATGGSPAFFNIVAFQTGSAVRLCSIKQVFPATISFYDSTNVSNTDLGTGLLGSVPFKNWASYVEIMLTVGNPGSITVMIDGLLAFTAAGNFGAGTCNTVVLANGNIGGFTGFDDLRVNDTTGPAPLNGFMGDTRITSAPPTGDGAELQWTPLSGGVHYSEVDEYPIDYDASYVNAPAAGLTDTYTFGPLAAPVGTIAAVQVRDYAKTDSGGTDKLQAIARIGGADFLAPGGDQFVHAVYTGLDFIYPTNPSTGLPWTIAQINAAQFGQKRTV